MRRARLRCHSSQVHEVLRGGVDFIRNLHLEPAKFFEYSERGQIGQTFCLDPIDVDSTLEADGHEFLCDGSGLGIRTGINGGQDAFNEGQLNR